MAAPPCCSNRHRCTCGSRPRTACSCCARRACSERSMTDMLFDRDGWWDPRCRAFASLRSVSQFRLGLLRRWLGTEWHGRTVVDLGCGGGLLALPLGQAGARVVGVDLARRALVEA